MNINKILWTLPFISFFLGYIIINQIFQTKKDIELPNLIGKSIIQAAKILSDKNLNLRILSQKDEPDLEPGTIIMQNPVKQRVKENQTIYLVISKKPDAYKMPDFKGKKIDVIQKTVAKENLKTKIYYIQNILPENSCIAQHPLPNQNYTDKKIILYISAGNNKEIIFPNFKGCELAQVLQVLDLNNIKFKISKNNSKQGSIVIDQRPFAGSLIKLTPNLTVQLIV